MANNIKLPEKDTEIPLKLAQTWVAKWKKQTDEEVLRKKVDSYLIPKYNLEKVLAEGIDAARAYIGVNEQGLQTLMIVGTRYDDKTGIYVDVLPGYGVECTEDGGGIYDFSEPSPPATADPNSPMNQ
ncbi:hypothetical protein IRZ83_09425 [Flavobacterium sp. JLP]|uniref:hypothetical protein n=1 Tax=unclassified Flavobacterium TaxID=196869 RepID=UPI0006897E71|nr:MULTISPECIES: hypothetical protein [unclassified Flavobacterium]MBF4492634.1 hypothetical protein [Flavobacterium sp. MR2016-29]MBF4506891.1 hypothetical protein [Flavobacterium sp. JLP]